MPGVDQLFEAAHAFDKGTSPARQQAKKLEVGGVEIVVAGAQRREIDRSINFTIDVNRGA